MTSQYRKGAHCIFSLQVHTYFVTMYRKKCLSQEMVERINDIAGNVLIKNKCILSECKGEGDHVHLLIDMHPDNNISRLLGSIKSATSRGIRKEFDTELKTFYPNLKTGLWGAQLYVRSAGGASVEILQQYIQAHSRG
jgi:putative transposase